MNFPPNAGRLTFTVCAASVDAFGQIATLTIRYQKTVSKITKAEVLAALRAGLYRFVVETSDPEYPRGLLLSVDRDAEDEVLVAFDNAGVDRLADLYESVHVGPDIGERLP